MILSAERVGWVSPSRALREYLKRESFLFRSLEGLVVAYLGRKLTPQASTALQGSLW